MWRYFACAALIIATGGTSQLYETNSGPTINTGDGIAIAMRAGAELVDIEFMQFIPISFVYPPSARGYTLTEPAHYGMRHFDPKAEAAHLLNNKGERFVLKHDPVRREGSTRDVLARAIMLEILEGRGTPEGGVLMMPDPEVFDSFLKERPIYVKRLLENYGEGQARLQAADPGHAERVVYARRRAHRSRGAALRCRDCWPRAKRRAASTARTGSAEARCPTSRSSAAARAWRPRKTRAAAAQPIRGSRAGACARCSAQRAARRELRRASDRGQEARAEAHVGSRRHRAQWREARRRRCALSAKLREHVLPTVKVTDKSRVLNREWMESIELENILDIGEAMAAASLQRTETRGAFYRTDFPAVNPDWTANLWIKRDGRALKVEKRAVQTRVPLQPTEPKHKAPLTLGEV